MKEIFSPARERSPDTAMKEAKKRFYGLRDTLYTPRILKGKGFSGGSIQADPESITFQYSQWYNDDEIDETTKRKDSLNNSGVKGILAKLTGVDRELEQKLSNPNQARDRVFVTLCFDEKGQKFLYVAEVVSYDAHGHIQRKIIKSDHQNTQNDRPLVIAPEKALEILDAFEREIRGERKKNSYTPVSKNQIQEEVPDVTAEMGMYL